MIILQLNEPVATSGIWNVTPPAVYRQFIKTEDASIAHVLSAMAVEDTVTTILSVVAAESEEDRPTSAVVERAVALLRAAQIVEPIYLRASEVEGFEGDLLIHWRTPQKRVTLVAPKQSDQSVRLHKRRASGWSEFANAPSPADMVSALKWLLL